MELGKLSAKVTADIQDYQNKMGQVSKVSEKTATTSSKVIAGIGSALSAIAVVATATATAIGGAFLVISKHGIQVSAQLETARQGFVALLGSADEADTVMSRIKREAKATPFEMSGLVVGAQALTAITKDGNKAIDILLDVGKAIATSGKGSAELDRVIMNLQQVASTGVVTEMDIRQFQGAIPMFNDILEFSGLTTRSLKESANSAELLFGAFEKAGAEGGITAGGFTAQAGTWNQLISNTKDTWDIFTSDFVNKSGVFDIVKGLIMGLNEAFSILSPILIEFAEKLGLTEIKSEDVSTAIVDFIENTIDWFSKLILKYNEVMNSPFMTGAKVVIEAIFNGAKIAIEEFWAVIKMVWEFVLQWWDLYLKPAFNELGLTLGKVFGDGGQQSVAFSDIMKVVGRTLTYVIGGIVISLTTIITAVVNIINWFFKFQQSVATSFGKAKLFINGFIDGAKVGLNRLVSDIKNIGDIIKRVLTAPFSEAKKVIDKIMEGMRVALDKINPFHRESPSLIDNIRKGVGIIQDQYANLSNISLDPITSGIGLTGVSGANNMPISISMAGANISSPEVAGVC